MSLTAAAVVMMGATAGHAASLADSRTLYNALCARCHGVLALSRVARASSGDIQDAINANKCGMRSISLTKAQLATGDGSGPQFVK